MLSAKEMHTYPSLEVLLQILTTGPVTTATNEHSFSALRYLETYLWFTTKEARLNGLVLLIVHRDLNINFKFVIVEFSRIQVSSPKSSGPAAGLSGVYCI